jgi:hypothetical protein
MQLREIGRGTPPKIKYCSQYCSTWRELSILIHDSSARIYRKVILSLMQLRWRKHFFSYHVYKWYKDTDKCGNTVFLSLSLFRNYNSSNTLSASCYNFSFLFRFALSLITIMLFQCRCRDNSVIYCDGLRAGWRVSTPSQQDSFLLHCFQTDAEGTRHYI